MLFLITGFVVVIVIVIVDVRNVILILEATYIITLSLNVKAKV